MELTVKIKSVTLLLTSGTDIIRIYLDEPSPFPNMNYDAVFAMECQFDCGLDYCRNVLKIEPEVKNLRTKI